MGVTIRARAKAAAGPLCGFVVVYWFFALTRWGRALDLLTFHGRSGTGFHVRRADAVLLDTISTGTVLLALATLVVIGGLRGRRRLALRCTAAVLGAVESAEVLKHLLPSLNFWDQRWRWLNTGSFPSGHTAVVTSISLAVLSVSSPAWRQRLVGPLVAGTAIASTALVTNAWHRPSDVLGSFFLATAWHRALVVPGLVDREPVGSEPVGSEKIGSEPVGREPAAAGPWRLVRRRPFGVRLVGELPSEPATIWWTATCVLVLGAAVDGILTHPQYSRRAAVVYFGALAVLLLGSLITIVIASARETVSTGQGSDPAPEPQRMM